MNNRSCAWLIALVIAMSGVALGQAVDVPKASSVEHRLGHPSLEQMKADGILRSKYLGRNYRFDESVLPKSNFAKFEQDIKPILQRACVSCHGPDSEEGNIRIDTLDADLVDGQDVPWWLEVLAVLSNGEMPPPEAEQSAEHSDAAELAESGLTDEDRGRVVEWLSSELQLASALRRHSGDHSSFRRMTRYEYNYALQDILGLSWDFAKDLPPESHSQDGFQNSSEMLHMTVMQFETYRQLARRALQRATVPVSAEGVVSDPPPVVHWAITMRQAADREWSKQAAQLEEIKEKFKDDPIKQKQELDQLAARFSEPHRRTYYRELSTGRMARAEWAYDGAKYAFEPTKSLPVMPAEFDHVAIIPSGRTQSLTIELGNQIADEGTMRVRVRASRTSSEQQRVPSLQLEFGWQASNEGRAEIRVSSEDTPIPAGPECPGVYQWDFPLGEIYPRNSVRNVSKMGDLPSPSEYIRLINSSVPKDDQDDVQLDYVEVMAPVYEQWPPQSHQRIFFESVNRKDESIYAREILTSFMSRAWRGGVSRTDVDRKLALFRAMREQCGSLEEAMVEVLAAVLSSPRFIYISGDDPTQQENDFAEGNPQRTLTAQELATRLSMFLWCSVPDAELLDLAANGQLLDSKILQRQVDRLLADPRSTRFSEHFVRQWLNMQLLDFLNIEQNSRSIDPLLKEAMQHEPVAFFEEMLRSDESVLNFIHADYAVVNERLAVHYGLAGVEGNQFRRVALDASQRRGGLLTQAGLLAMNSDGVDSHPLKRGVWLLERILNDPPPPPPPAVPEIDLADPEIAKLTLKQRIENHRDHAACNSCHVKIDPWGIAFENFDALGLWRDSIQGQPVDATSLLFNKQELNGVDGLKRFLLENRQDQFVRALVHKMTTYALGRPLTFSDHTGIDQVTAQVRLHGDGLATMVRFVVASELFQTK